MPLHLHWPKTRPLRESVFDFHPEPLRYPRARKLGFALCLAALAAIFLAALLWGCGSPAVRLSEPDRARMDNIALALTDLTDLVRQTGESLGLSLPPPDDQTPDNAPAATEEP